MPKAPVSDDPASLLNKEAQALAAETRLNVYLDQIIEAERTRNQASDAIKMLWKAIGREGFDVEQARRQLVRRVIAA